MKWPRSPLAILAAALLATASARPTDNVDDACLVASGQRAYTLKVVASGSPAHNRYLSIGPSGHVGVYPVAAVPAKFAVAATGQTDAASPDDRQYALHTLPAGLVDHVLALSGTPALSYLKEVVNPTAVATDCPGGPHGCRLDWQSFTLGGLSAPADCLAQRDQTSKRVAQVPPPLLANGLSYAGTHGGWILVQNDAMSYAVAWYDGFSALAQTHHRIDIAYEEA